MYIFPSNAESGRMNALAIGVEELTPPVDEAWATAAGERQPCQAEVGG
jgi:hypothetical protein